MGDVSERGGVGCFIQEDVSVIAAEDFGASDSVLTHPKPRPAKSHS